jgi:hypothetical protein
MTEVARVPELVPVLREYNDAWRTLCESVFEQLGSDDPAHDARMFVWILDSLCIMQAALDEPDFEGAQLRPALQRTFRRAAEHSGG